MTLQNYLLITELIKQKHYINDFFFCIFDKYFIIKYMYIIGLVGSI